MKFNRGKSVKDPIYLRKNAKDFWMEGDVYENFCKCLNEIFGPKGYFVNSFTPKMVDFATGIAFNCINVTDKDGDTHTFFGRVIDADTFDVSQRGGNFRDKAVEKIQTVEKKETREEVVDDQDGLVDVNLSVDINKEEDFMKDEYESIKEAMKRETEIETLNAEVEKESLTTEDVSVNIPKKRKIKRKKKKA